MGTWTANGDGSYTLAAASSKRTAWVTDTQFPGQSGMKLIVDDLKMKQHGMQNESLAVKTKIAEQEKFKRQFKDDILECLNYLSDAKQLKKQVVRLHKIYVKNEGSPNEVGEADFHVEQIARRQQLEGQLSQLKNKLD